MLKILISALVLGSLLNGCIGFGFRGDGHYGGGGYYHHHDWR